MDISDGKTEVMVQRSRLSSKKGESAEIKLMNSDNEEVTLKVVSEFKYLCVMISAHKRMDENNGKVFNVWKQILIND